MRGRKQGPSTKAAGQDGHYRRIAGRPLRSRAYTHEGPEEVDLQDALNQWAADAVPMGRWAEPTQPGVGVVVLGTDPGDKVAWKALLSLGIVVLLIFCVIVPLTPGRIWKRVGSQFEMRTLEVSEQGIHRVTALTDALMRWPTFSEAIQRGDLYLLSIGLGPGMFLIP